MPILRDQDVSISSWYDIGLQSIYQHQEINIGTDFKDKYDISHIISVLWLAGEEAEAFTSTFEHNWTTYNLVIQPNTLGICITISEKYQPIDSLRLEKQLTKQEVSKLLASQLVLLTK